MRHTASKANSASHDLHKETHVWLFPAEIEDRVMLQNDFFLSPDAPPPKGDETIVICRPVPITDDTRPPELATTRLWKLAFTPSGPLVYGFDHSFAIENAHAGSFGDLVDCCPGSDFWSEVGSCLVRLWVSLKPQASVDVGQKTVVTPGAPLGASAFTSSALISTQTMQRTARAILD
jgi:hypothetical protein